MTGLIVTDPDAFDSQFEDLPSYMGAASSLNGGRSAETGTSIRILDTEAFRAVQRPLVYCSLAPCSIDLISYPTTPEMPEMPCSLTLSVAGSRFCAPVPLPATATGANRSASRYNIGTTSVVRACARTCHGIVAEVKQACILLIRD